MVSQSVKFVYADWAQFLRGFHQLADLAQIAYSLTNIIVPKGDSSGYIYAGDITYVFEWENAELMNEFWKSPKAVYIIKALMDGPPELVIIN